MTYYSPGESYFCPQCKSESVGFIIDDKYKKWLDTMRLIKAKKVKLSNLYKDYKTNPDSIKWMCYKCRDCGIVQKG